MSGQPNWRIEQNPDDPGNFTRVDLPPAEPPVGIDARKGFAKKPDIDTTDHSEEHPPLLEED